jgi:hypothetical protein
VHESLKEMNYTVCGKLLKLGFSYTQLVTPPLCVLSQVLKNLNVFR